MARLCGLVEMKLGSLKTGQRDGSLVVVNDKLTRMKAVPEIAPNLQTALENWINLKPKLEQVYQSLNQNQCDAITFSAEKMMAPLPRAYQWLDGSAYLSHVERVRKARGAALPPSLLEDPLMYQGASDDMLGPQDPIRCADEDWGIDFEAEVGIITDDVPQGTTTPEAQSHIKLLLLINDVSLRNLIPGELAKGFGFIQGKPASAFSAVAVTPDELGSAWADNKIHLPLQVFWNEQPFGQANAGIDMQFDFARLISHAAQTRRLSAGTIIGSGTVSNYEPTAGCSCIVEQRVREIIDTGNVITEFMRFGDHVRIEMLDQHQQTVFGAIDQVVQKWP